MSSSIPSCTVAICRSCTERARHRQSGQTAIEFLFALLILIAGMAGLYQVLHFERDVFNRLLYIRQMGLREAHRDQDVTKKTLFVTDPMEFRRFGELLNSPVPLQVIDPSLRYPTKVLHLQKGTRFRDPMEMIPASHNPWEIGGVMTLTELNEKWPRWRTMYGSSGVQHAAIIAFYLDDQ